MEKTLYALKEALQKKISAFHPDYVLELKKEKDTFYVIGDHLDLIDHTNVFHGGLRHNQFLLFINIRKPYMIHISEWKNDNIFPPEEFREFAKKELFSIFNHHQGYVAFKQKFGLKPPILKCYGEKFKHSYSLSKEFLGKSDGISPTADYQWFRRKGLGMFYIGLTEEGLQVCFHNQTYHQTLTTTQEIHEFINLVDDKIDQLELFKKRLIENFSISKDKPWGNTHSYSFFPENLYLADCRLTVYDGQLMYHLKCNQESLYYPNTDALFEKVKEMYMSIKTNTSTESDSEKE